MAIVSSLKLPQGSLLDLSSEVVEEERLNRVCETRWLKRGIVQY